MKICKIFEINGKDKTYWQILDAAVSLDMKVGHLKWTIASLAKQAKVSRPLIYHYFGRSKENILLESICYFNKYILGTSPEQMKEWENHNITPSIKIARELLDKIPAIIPFYYINRTKDNAIGRALREQRAILFKKLKHFFPQLEMIKIQVIKAMLFGIIFYPELPVSVVESSCEEISKMIFPNNF
ncbi:MAG: hypothetical protein A2504_09440 [Bdellovibrionales bacterium RIFOXYD12_FULL_39_22]|nr:MAG: hypothetical protein A2385_12930 [Bdellovibrionales bacterium RIFOXYB1_FULL_39_21]OFZ40949.1 MAG: hypothetical protein A2485_16440 [Bdellovibrionales bacterium RIFOXYC12_FULL_39_17]OFZ44777.1 MAG: hypothetical protein A2404_09730 [Bdellovibrionales bacterium RIFOXYC1_FULL_39_130]OFZ73258.1 MAG: hypothetical protein A2451_07695 [Bdellovibrionales bacterium RIFOXYC2_FULL_39_8]OFZ74242.1 MAG: hypothetical protein A2560_16695 [Bdellovibrionales bacterium RIFOXYD1_FULL_39_84]OFZ92106.1 MAG: